MTVLTPLRRLGLSIVALGASAAIVTGCSSSTAGNPLGLGTGGNSSAVGVNSAANSSAPNSSAANSSAANSSAAVPGNGASSAASTPAITSSGPVASVSVGGGTGGSNAAFCRELSTLGSDLSSSASDPTGAKAAAAKYQKLANVAPSEIKPDMQKMADYLNSLANGKVPDPSTTADLSATVQRIVKYLTTACI